ncbi:helix-turn-helix domain-containing protein [Scytonema tolypothrichoides VB-61278]|nr:helix-turn-helix domain-containing protein [Scytonema tolypothrichoides VB-61278]
MCEADTPEPPLPAEHPVRGEELRRAEIAAHQPAAPSAVERRRWQVISLLADGVPVAEIVALTGYRRRTIRDIARRYRATGGAGLVDKRTQSPGAPPLLTPALRHELWLALQRSPPSGERWTGPKVATWIAARTGKDVHRQRGWEYFRHLQSSPEPEQDS